MKAATILALLIGTNAIRLTDPTKKHSYPDAARILHLDPKTEFPDYPAGSIKQLDEGLCRSTDCGYKPKANKPKKELDSDKEAAEKVKAPPVAEDATEAKKDKKDKKAVKPAEEEKKEEAKASDKKAAHPSSEGSDKPHLSK